MLTHRPVFLFVMIIAPLACMLFFTSLMREGLPTSLPAAMVDADDTPTTRKLCRVIDAMELTGIRYKYRTFSEAHKAMETVDRSKFPDDESYAKAVQEFEEQWWDMGQPALGMRSPNDAIYETLGKYRLNEE